ncbi:hypothetical protein C808_05019 [Lachnospiraceae bacterium M18-1]|nr:hypothetical protein C808_05019 [Lachnospiraceae bacterium M18-1]
MYGEINVCGIYGRKGIENESESKNEKKGQKMISNKEYKECIKICSAGIYRDIQIHKGKFLISGATGLIGTALINCLLEMNDTYAADFKVIAMAQSKERAIHTLGMYSGRADLEFVSSDVNNPIPELGEVDYIIHAASNTHPLAYSSDPIGTIKTNIIGTNNLLDYAVSYLKKRFVFLSSVEIYGENRGGKASFSEMDCGYLNCNQVRSGYPESKRAGESLCCAYEKKYGIDIVIPRLCRVYGPTMGQNDSKALAQFIKKAVDGKDIVLKSKGQQFYSYIHVIDAVTAIFYILDKGKSGEAYNVSSQLSDIKLSDLAKKLSEISGTKVVFEVPDEFEKQGYSNATNAILDNTKLKKLGWKETYDIDSGLRMTVQILKNLKD